MTCWTSTGIRRRGAPSASPTGHVAQDVAARLQAPRSLWTRPTRRRAGSPSGQADPADPVAARADRGALPGHEAGDDRVQLRRRRPHLGRARPGRRARDFGREGLYLGNYWGDGPGNGNLPSYIEAAYRLYRNYDGKRGDVRRHRRRCDTADIAKASIYAATDTKRGPADDPGDQQGAAVDLQRRRSPSRAASRQGAGLHARRQQPGHQAAGAGRHQERPARLQAAARVGALFVCGA